VLIFISKEQIKAQAEIGILVAKNSFKRKLNRLSGELTRRHNGWACQECDLARR